MGYYLTHPISGNKTGLGYFIVQLPCIDYYTLDLGDTIYYNTSEKIKCLVPVRKNLIIENHNKGITIPVDNSNPYHPTAGWIPRITKFEGNFSGKEPFVYPKIEFNDEILSTIKNKFSFNKEIITFAKLTGSDPNRNWNEDGWNNLIKELSKDFICIDVCSKDSSVSCSSYAETENLLNVGDNYNLFEIAHLIKLSKCFIGLDCGMFHLSTAVKCKTIVIQTISDTGWYYPNTIRIDSRNKNNKNVVDEILKKVYE